MNKSLVCIDVNPGAEIRFHLTLGKAYEIAGLGYNAGWIVVIDDTGKNESYPLKRFMYLNEYRKQKLNNLNQIEL